MSVDAKNTSPSGPWSRQDWANLLRTVDLSLAMAEVKDDKARLAAALADQACGRFGFTLMAAASSGKPKLPEEQELLSRNRTMGLRVARHEGRLIVTVQAKGANAIRTVAGRWAALFSADGVVNASLTFNRDGQARTELRDEATIQDALADVEIVVPSASFKLDGDDEP